jgi:hypothetical protein
MKKKEKNEEIGDCPQFLHNSERKNEEKKM